MSTSLAAAAGVVAVTVGVVQAAGVDAKGPKEAAVLAPMAAQVATVNTPRPLASVA